MKTPSPKTNGIILSVCEVVIGVLLLVKPVGFTKGIITFLGILLLVKGVLAVIQYFREPPVKAAAEQGLTWGCLGILVGLFCILRNDWFIATFPVLTVLYGIGTLVSGIAKLQKTVDLIRLKFRKWYWAGISAALTLICAAIIIGNPFATTAVLWTFIAVTLILEAAADIVAAFFAKTE